MAVQSSRSILVVALCALSVPAVGACDGLISTSRTDALGSVDRYVVEAPVPRGEQTEILVLGTAHLTSLGDDFSHDLLSTLLDRLGAYDPDVIGVESLPPREIRRLAAAAESTEAAALLVQAFAGDIVQWGQVARATLGWSAVEAERAASEAISGGTTLDAITHRRLALQFLAADDLPNALLHWAYLPEGERRGDDIAPAEVADFLTERLGGADERTSIGIELARRLGHRRIASIDDHVDDEIGIETGLNERLMAELEGNVALAELIESGYMEEAGKRLSEAAKSGDLLPFYRQVNTPDHLNADIAAQWHLFYRTGLESGRDRARAALWEARNLHIAARIREASAFHPAGRVLVVIGAAHKPFLDRYLAQMMDVEVVDAASVLGTDEIPVR